MKFSKTSVGPGICILASDDYQAIPMVLANSQTVVKAGTPITAAGAAALNGSNAIGILLYDVDTAVNPNAAVVVAGIIDYNKIVANATVTATAATLHTAIPAIFFRTKTGKQTAMAVSATTATVAAGSTTTVTLTNAVGTVTATSSASTKATAVESSGTVTITGVAQGTATITLTDAIGQTASVAVTVTAAEVG